MKRILAIILALVLCAALTLALVSCDNGNADGDPSENGQGGEIVDNGNTEKPENPEENGGSNTPEGGNENVQLHDHTPKDAVRENEVAASCTEDGSYDEVVYCAQCDYEFSREKKTEKALGHSFEDYKCGRCGEEIKPSEGLTFVPNGDGTCYLSNHGTCTDSDVVIPKVSPEGDVVTAIGKEAFLNYNTQLTSLIMPDSIKSIGDWAFCNRVDLKSIEIVEGVESIGERAFQGCKSITKLVIPDSVTTLGEYAFDCCESLKSLTIGNGIKTLPRNAFSCCSSLRTLTIPDSVENIGENAFSGCLSLMVVEIGENVASIGRDAFSGAPVYKIINRSDLVLTMRSNYDNGSVAEYAILIVDKNGSKTYDNTEYREYFETDDGFIFMTSTSLNRPTHYLVTYLGESDKLTLPLRYRDSGYSVSDLKAVKHIVIPDGADVTLQDRAFYQNYALESIEIGDSVVSIGESAFSVCINLKNITVSENNPVYKSVDNVLYSKDGKVLIKYALAKQDTSFTVPTDVEEIGNEAFYNSQILTSIVIPEGVKIIGDNAMCACGSLVSVEIPDTVESVGVGAFDGCTKLTFNEYDNAKYLGNTASPYLILVKAKENTVKSCEINSKTKYICSNAFYGCPSLSAIIIPDSVKGIGECAFYNASSLTNAVIGNGVKSIGEYAFYSCTRLSSVSIGTGISDMGYRAFIGCTNLSKVIIGSIESWCRLSFEDKETNPLYYANKLYLGDTLVTELVVPDSITRINSNAFAGCTSITSVILGDGVETIENGAFWECTSIESIVIPDTLKNVGSYAFNSCSRLKTVYYNGDLNAWKAISVDSRNNDKFSNATRYYYSETEPNESGSFWHYDENGKPVAWN